MTQNITLQPQSAVPAGAYPNARRQCRARLVEIDMEIAALEAQQAHGADNKDRIATLKSKHEMLLNSKK